jgi:tetratricopeptide (TPR) repeat protein
MKKIFVFLSLLINFVVYSQQPIDSLLLELNKTTVTIDKIKTLDELAWQLKYNYPDSAKSFANQGIKLAVNEYEIEQIGLYNTLGIISRSTNDIVNAKEYYHKAVLLADKFKRYNRKASSYANIGVLYKNLRQYDSAIFYYNKAELSLDYKTDSAKAFNLLKGLIFNKATVYSELHKEILALEEYKKIEPYYIKTKNNENLADLYTNIANIHGRLKDHTQELRYHKKSLDLEMKLNNLRGVCESYSAIGTSFSSLKQKDSALFYLNKSLELAKKHRFLKQTAFAYYLLGEHFDNFEDFKGFEKSLEYYKKSLEYADENQDVSYTFFSLTNIAQLNVYLDNLSEVLPYLKEAESYPDYSNDSFFLQTLYDTYTIYYFRTGNLEQALKYNTLYDSVVSINFNKEKRVAIQEIEIRYETEKKEKENLLLTQKNLEEENKNQSLTITLLFTVLGLIAVVLLFAIVFFYQKKIRKRLGENLEKESKKAQRAFSENEQQLIKKWEDLKNLNKRPSENSTKIKQCSTELFELFDLCYPNFASNLQSEHPKWTLPKSQLKLCKLYAMNWFDTNIIVSTGITANNKSLTQLRRQVRLKLDVNENHEIFKKLEKHLR